MDLPPLPEVPPVPPSEGLPSDTPAPDQARAETAAPPAGSIADSPDSPIDWPTTLPPLPLNPVPAPSIVSRGAQPLPDRSAVSVATTLPTVIPIGSDRMKPGDPGDTIEDSGDADDNAGDEDEDSDSTGRILDPALAWIVVVAATIIGLGGLAPDVRYTVLWTALIVIGLLAILFDRLEVEIPTASDMAWGIGYGLLVAIPLVVIALPQLRQISQQAFVGMSNAYIFQSLVLIMPLSDALFFRGAIQPTRGLFFTVGVASLWSALIFFPQLNVLTFPLVAVVIAFAFVILNFLYSYLKRRFGLFASWTCQITINLLLLFVVRFLT